MRKVARRFAGLLVVVAGAGCSFETDDSSDSNQLGSTMGGDATESAGGDTQSGSAGTEGSTSFGGGSTSVGNDEACVDTCAPATPGGWNGPFYIVDAANPIDCPTGFARQDLGFRGLSAEAATCSCSCDEGAGDCHVNFQLSLDNGCNGTIVDENLQDGSCNLYGVVAGNVRMLAQLGGAPVSCTPNVDIGSPEPTWDSARTFCAAPVRGGDCGAEQCIAENPDGYSTQLCISSNGDVGCPGGGWDSRTVVYRSFEDARTCEGCSCSGPTACEAQVSAYDNIVCSGGPQEVPLDACTDLSVSDGYSVGAAVDNGTCEASEVTPAGQATPNDPVTLCCTS